MHSAINQNHDCAFLSGAVHVKIGQSTSWPWTGSIRIPPAPQILEYSLELIERVGKQIHSDFGHNAPPWKPVEWQSRHAGWSVFVGICPVKNPYESNLWQACAKIHTSTSALVQCDTDMIKNGTWHKTLVETDPFSIIFHWSLAAMQAAIEMSSRDEAEGLCWVVFFSA